MRFEDYGQWNPFITSIKGQPIVGTQLVNTLALPGKKAQVFKPTILAVTEQQEFRWLGSLFVRGLFDGEHYFRLEEISPQQTKLIHGEHFSGLLAGLIMRLIKEDTLQGFNRMNEALKALCEA